MFIFIYSPVNQMKKQFLWYQVLSKAKFVLFILYLPSSKTLFFSHKILMTMFWFLNTNHMQCVVLCTIIFDLYFAVLCLDFIKKLFFFSFDNLIGHVFVVALTKLQFQWLAIRVFVASGIHKDCYFIMSKVMHTFMKCLSQKVTIL